MISVETIPALPKKPAPGPFVQTVRLIDQDQTIAEAAWKCYDTANGVVELCLLHVRPDLRRKGIGQRLLDETISSARRYHAGNKHTLKMLWMGVEQKSQVIGRAFLMNQNFHHISTASNIYGDQDLLIFVRSLG